MADQTSVKKIEDVIAPSITKHSSSISENLVPAADKDLPSINKPISNIGANIAPVSAATPDAVVSTAETPVEPKTTTPEPEQSPEPTPSLTQTSPYEASDSLPDVSQKMTTEMTNEMQAPRIYDTKEYVVPIKDTMHSHGTVGRVLAGVISAAVVVGMVIAAAYFLV